MKIAFDIDGTLWKIRPKYKDQVPDYDLINILKWFIKNGDEVFVWSAGGIEYAERIVQKLGINDLVKVVAKQSKELDKKNPLVPDMDIAFDDCETTLAKV